MTCESCKTAGRTSAHAQSELRDGLCVECWQQRAEKAEKILERLKVTAEEVPDPRFRKLFEEAREHQAYWFEAYDLAQAEYVAMKQRAEAAEKSAAEMREVITNSHKHGAILTRSFYDALPTATAGTNYVPRAELEQAQKKIAEMREALEQTRRYDMGTRIPNEWFIRRDRALSTAGTNYLSPEQVKEQVRPLVKALQEADCNIAHANTCPWTYDMKNPCNCGAQYTECQITDALQRAEAKGWL